MIKGLLNINKPKGYTSQDVVSVARKALSTRDIGHMGTLDPQGEGVLILGVGKATRLFDFMLKKDKTYRAEFEFGYETDTLDADGKVIDETNSIPSQKEIEEKITSFIGKQNQLPPKYSAKNVNGKRAYDLARSGIDFELKTCEIEIYDLRIIEKTGKNKYLFEINCSGGTYVRSVCRDLAYSLNSLATMTSIFRTKCGKFTIETSITLEELKEKKTDAIISLDEVFSNVNRYDVGETLYTKLSNGIKIHVDNVVREPFVVYCKNELFGLGKIEEGFLKIKTYLRD